MFVVRVSKRTRCTMMITPTCCNSFGDASHHHHAYDENWYQISQVTVAADFKFCVHVAQDPKLQLPDLLFRKSRCKLC